jgi:hypothetical protein
MVQTNQQDKTVSADGHQATGGRGVPQRPHGATKEQRFQWLYLLNPVVCHLEWNASFSSTNMK